MVATIIQASAMVSQRFPPLLCTVAGLSIRRKRRRESSIHNGGYKLDIIVSIFITTFCFRYIHFVTSPMPGKKSQERHLQQQPMRRKGEIKKRGLRRARFSPAARNCPTILAPRNPGGDSAPHALGLRAFGACWFAALTAWLCHESNYDHQRKENQ